MTSAYLSSGIPGIDTALGGGLLAGDNVVWFGGTDEMNQAIARAFVAAGGRRARTTVVTTRHTPGLLERTLGRGIEVLDARPGKRLTDPMALERVVLERGRETGRVIIDGFDDFVRRLGRERALGLFTRICPQLFDAGAVCYWHAGDGAQPIRQGVRSVTQCVLDLADDRLLIEKAEGRHGVQGRYYRIRIEDGEVHVAEERAIGRLAQGLRRLRTERRLSQSDVARVAGVSPSAISQAEAGRRGLGLDTVMVIADGFSVGLDQLLGASESPGYVIARRDRSGSRGAVVPLLDDPTSGLRAYLVTLGPGERGEPPAAHKGTELVVVAAGLVQLDLGTETPVMRAGDAALATTVAVIGWRNLLGAPTRFFWILRDP